MILKNAFYISCLLQIALLGCSDQLPFEYSPFNAHLLPSYKGIHEKQKVKLQNLNLTEDITFYVMNGLGGNSKILNTFVRNMNYITEPVFIIFSGNMTEHGLKQEYIWFSKRLKTLKHPYFVTIGNGDYQNNGLLLYQQMFGHELDYFNIGSTHFFILFDSNYNESDSIHNLNLDQDLNWLTETLEAAKLYTNIFVITHFSPLDWPTSQRDRFLSLADDYAFRVVIDGTKQDYGVTQVGRADFLSLRSSKTTDSPSPSECVYAKVTISDNKATIEKISL